MLKKIKGKIYESKLQKKVGKQALENIKQMIYDELKDEILPKKMTLDEFEDYEIWSIKWVEFLDKTGLELMYEVLPILNDKKIVVDLKVEILDI